MASNPRNPDWEEERATHHSFLNHLGLLDVPDFVYPRQDVSHKVADFPLPSFRCSWSWCPLCLPTPSTTEPRMASPLTAPAAMVPVASTSAPPPKPSAVKEARMMRHYKSRRQWRAMWKRKLANGLVTKTTFGLENLSLDDDQCKTFKKKASVKQQHTPVPLERKMEKGAELYLPSVERARSKQKQSTLAMR